MSREAVASVSLCDMLSFSVSFSFVSVFRFSFLLGMYRFMSSLTLVFEHVLFPSSFSLCGLS